MAWTIYCHTHISSGRRYIGLTKRTWQERWRGHLHGAKHASTHFAHALLKYGKDAFSHRVLELCSSLEEANEAEAAWVESYSTRDPQFGFNLMRGGEHKPHLKRNPWDDPTFRARVTTSVKFASTKNVALRSRVSKDLWQDPQFRENNLTATLVARSDPSTGRAISDSLRKRFEDPKQIQSLRDLWRDPLFRNKCSSGLVTGTAKNRNKTHCLRGHEFTPENTSMSLSGSRSCRTCRRDRNANLKRDGKCECGKLQDSHTKLCAACKTKKERQRLQRLEQSTSVV